MHGEVFVGSPVVIVFIPPVVVVSAGGRSPKVGILGDPGTLWPQVPVLPWQEKRRTWTFFQNKRANLGPPSRKGKQEPRAPPESQ